MESEILDYAQLFVDGLPDPAPRWTGFPRYNFVGGHNDPMQIPVEGLASAAAAVLRREGANLAMYNLSHGPLGFRGLRDFVADKLRERRGIACSAEDVLITSGSGQGLELVNRIFLRPGDTVLAEAFSYGGALSRLRGRGVNVVGVPLDEDGMRIADLETILDDLQRKGISPKFLYTIPTVQNPTGSILPLERRRELLSLCARSNLLVVEDECYTDLAWAGEAPPALYALDPRRVIHVGSFSKSLAPALRVGYVVGDWQVISRLAACKTDGGTGALDQMVIAEYFGQHFDRHVAALSQVLRAKLTAMTAALDQEFGSAVEYTVPKGGIFLWIRVPDVPDVTRLVKPAADAGIAFNPGPEWACAPGAGSYMRLCFALPTEEDIRRGIAELARVCFEQTGIPARSANVAHARASLDRCAG